MRLFLTALCATGFASMALAETQPDLNRLSASQPLNESPKSDTGQAQPQGQAGPLTTGKGGASAANPQGGTPPNMQVAPEGSSMTSGDRK